MSIEGVAQIVREMAPTDVTLSTKQAHEISRKAQAEIAPMKSSDRCAELSKAICRLKNEYRI